MTTVCRQRLRLVHDERLPPFRPLRKATACQLYSAAFPPSTPLGAQVRISRFSKHAVPRINKRERTTCTSANDSSLDDQPWPLLTVVERPARIPSSSVVTQTPPPIVRTSEVTPSTQVTASTTINLARDVSFGARGSRTKSASDSSIAPHIWSSERRQRGSEARLGTLLIMGRARRVKYRP